MKNLFAMLLLMSGMAFSQTTINATNINTKNVTAAAGGGAGIDFRNASHTLPYKVGLIAGLPATCTVGERYFASNAVTGGQNSYSCTALNTWTLDFGAGVIVSSGTVDFSGAAHTLISRKGLIGAIPGTCTTGEEYFATDATAGRNKFYCTAPNVWTQQLFNSGTVSSAAMTVPAFMAVSGSPITTTGTFGVTFNNQAQGAVFIGPTSGSGQPTFRTLVANDITTTGTQDGTAALTGNMVWTQYQRVLDKQDVIAGANGNSADQTIYTYSMPSGTMAAGKCVRVTFFAQHTAGVGSTIYKVFFGATSVSTSSTTTEANTVYTVATVCNNAASTTAQWGVGQFWQSGGGNTTTTTPAENTNSGSAIVIKGTFNVAAGTSTGGKGWLVEYVP